MSLRSLAKQQLYHPLAEADARNWNGIWWVLAAAPASAVRPRWSSRAGVAFSDASREAIVLSRVRRLLQESFRPRRLNVR